VADDPVGDEVVFQILCRIQAREFARLRRQIGDLVREHPEVPVEQWVDWHGADAYWVATAVVLASRPGAETEAKSTGRVPADIDAIMRARYLDIVPQIALCLESLALAGRVEKVERASKGTEAGDDIVQAFRYRIPEN
jgi:hypothetical protein